MTVMGNFLQFATRSDTNWPVQSQKDRSLKFQKKEEEGSYYPCSKTQGADQLCSNCVFVFRICKKKNPVFLGFCSFRYDELREKTQCQPYCDDPAICDMIIKLHAYCHMDNKTVPFAKVGSTCNKG